MYRRNKIFPFPIICLLLFVNCSTLQKPPAPPLLGQKPIGVESKIVRLNSKIEAMETKLTVLADSLNLLKATKSQPKVQAISPVKTTTAPIAKPSPISPSPIEKKFQRAVKFFQKEKYKLASTGFQNFFKQHKKHSLAPEALYWAGKSHMRLQNWNLAIQQWERLEREHPQAVRLPETLSGLSRAYAALADFPKAKHYREILAKGFPNAPATLDFISIAKPEIGH